MTLSDLSRAGREAGKKEIVSLFVTLVVYHPCSAGLICLPCEGDIHVSCCGRAASPGGLNGTSTEAQPGFSKLYMLQPALAGETWSLDQLLAGYLCFPVPHLNPWDPLCTVVSYKTSSNALACLGKLLGCHHKHCSSPLPWCRLDDLYFLKALVGEEGQR